MRTLLVLLLAVTLAPYVRAQTTNSEAARPLTYYLPDHNYDPDITTPEEFLGWQIGDWHLSHDLQQAYLRLLAAESDRITLEDIGRSYEDRPLLNLIVSSPENQSRLEEIRSDHYFWNERNSDVNDREKVAAVLYQGFSIHGNEPSGGNAAPLVAYYLAAAPYEAVMSVLDNNVIILDPCYNPDGFNRFASWVNTHKNKEMTPDGNDREYNEAWPGGRTNHYWFDLNRDWLPVQHPESRTRIERFHRWRPNVLTDHHEMGTNATFFFMPGEPTRVHPMTPAINQTLTAKIGKYHARALDKIGSLYYSGEGYDDYYYGKGSTYPDINGAVGILFEQASSRGHLQESENGLLDFPFTVRNQVTTALSTIEAFGDLRDELLDYQREFNQEGVTSDGYVFTTDGDAGRARELAELLRRHNVPMKQNGDGNPSEYWVQATPFVKAVFDPIFEFGDSLFYDVSTFVLPYAFNLPYRKTTGGLPKGGDWMPLGGTNINDEAPTEVASYAYLLPWDDYYSSAALYQLQAAGCITKMSGKPFRVGDREFPRGTVMIPVGNNQPVDARELHDMVSDLAETYGLNIAAVNSGSVDEGLMLGSRSAYVALRQPKIALLVEGGVRSYDAGEVWHLLDQRMGVPVTKLPLADVADVDLDRYNTIIMVNGNYDGLSGDATVALRNWMGDGRVLITQQGASVWAASAGLARFKTRSSEGEDVRGQRPYEMASRDRGGRVLGGAIYEARVDLTHPLLFGLRRTELPIFKRGTLVAEPAGNVYASPIRFDGNSLLSGYSPRGFEGKLSGSAGVVVSSLNGGRSISFADNLNFRAFWYGTNRVFLNAIFFGDAIGAATVER